MELTKDIYWNMRSRCLKGEHKFRENAMGITWCVVCGNLAIKACGTLLEDTDKIIITNLKSLL